MEFTVEFYETAQGRAPVLEFLDELKESDPDDHAAVLAGLAKLQNRQYHREPLSKSLGGGLFELRHVGKLNSRVFGSLSKAGASSRSMVFVTKRRRFLRATSLRLASVCATGRKDLAHENEF